MRLSGNVYFYKNGQLVYSTLFCDSFQNCFFPPLSKNFHQHFATHFLPRIQKCYLSEVVLKNPNLKLTIIPFRQDSRMSYEKIKYR
jgi:hypothetical protein